MLVLGIESFECWVLNVGYAIIFPIPSQSKTPNVPIFFQYPIPNTHYPIPKIRGPTGKRALWLLVGLLAAGNPSRSRRDFMKNRIFKISKKNHNVKKNWKKYKSCVQNLYVTNDILKLEYKKNGLISDVREVLTKQVSSFHSLYTLKKNNTRHLWCIIPKKTNKLKIQSLRRWNNVQFFPIFLYL